VTVDHGGNVPVYLQLAAILRAHLTSAEEAAYAISIGIKEFHLLDYGDRHPAWVGQPPAWIAWPHPS
jgi:hypothetical protein